MTNVSHITVRVYSKEEENGEEIKNSIISMFPFDVVELKLLNISRNAGFNKKTITEYRVELGKKNQIGEFIGSLNEKLTKEQKEFLINTFDARFNDDFELFIRLFKSELIRGNYQITDSGDCFHIKMTVTAFPHTKEVAKKNVEEIFKSV